MPFTFLAHQAPLLPLKRRWGGLDGVAMCVGSAVPDMAAVTQHATARWLFGRPLWWDGHSPSQQIAWTLPVGLVLTWLVRRLLAPRLAPYLPDLGSFHLQDLQFVARTRHRWYLIVSGVLIGGYTHILIDGFTHGDADAKIGFLPGLDTHIDVGVRIVRLASVFQVVFTVGLSLWCVWELYVIGRRHLVRRWSAVTVDDVGSGAPHRVGVLAAVAVVLAGAAAWAGTQYPRGSRVVFFTWVWLSIAGLALVSIGVGVLQRRPSFSSQRNDVP